MVSGSTVGAEEMKLSQADSNNSATCNRVINAYILCPYSLPTLIISPKKSSMVSL